MQSITASVPYYDQWDTLVKLYNDVKNDEYINSNTVDCWYIDFSAWMNSTNDPSITSKLNSGEF